MNFALTDNKLSNFEFARIWGEDGTNEALRIDLAGSDRTDTIDLGDGVQGYYPVYSMHYVDLKLKDFNSGSVDYSNYDPSMEIDEHNLRLKLDTEYSYNDDNIKLLDINSFKPVQDSYLTSNNSSTEGITIDVSKIPSSESNVTLLKARLKNPLNIAQYDAIKIGLTLDGTTEGSISGLALYVSNTYESETPSNIKNEPDEDVVLLDTLPDLNSSQQEIIDLYGNSIVKRYEPVNGTGGYVYYQSRWDSNLEKWVWGLKHDVKSYDIYEIINRNPKTTSNALTITEDNNGKKQYYEITVDPNKVNLQNAKEIGLICLNDENKYSASNVTTVTLNEFITVQQDYYPIFSAKQNDQFTMTLSPADTVSKFNPSGSISVVGTTEPATAQIIMNYHNSDETKKTAISPNGCVVAEFDATSKNTKNYNHIGIQMASDCFITKDMLELHLVQVNSKGVETIIDKIRLPTNNYMYYPTQSKKAINLIQVFKKLETTERFDKIQIYATSKFLENAQKLKTIEGSEKDGCDGNKTISLFIGDISLYQARSIPMFHPRMRMKFYFDQATTEERDYIKLRKIGVVADFQ